MLALVYKDFVVQRTVILVYLAGAILFTTPVIYTNAPVVIAVMLAMTFPFASTTQDDRANSHLLLNSLPVTRREIVTAKYVFHMAASVCLVGVTVICEAAFDGLSPRAALSQVLIAAGVVAWFLAVFFPMYYGLGPRFVQSGSAVSPAGGGHARRAGGIVAHVGVVVQPEEALRRKGRRHALTTVASAA